MIPNIFIALKYFMMVFTTFIYYQKRFLTKRLIINLTKAIFNLVPTIENINSLVIS